MKKKMRRKADDLLGDNLKAEMVPLSFLSIRIVAI